MPIITIWVQLVVDSQVWYSERGEITNAGESEVVSRLYRRAHDALVAATMKALTHTTGFGPTRIEITVHRS